MYDTILNSTDGIESSLLINYCLRALNIVIEKHIF